MMCIQNLPISVSTEFHIVNGKRGFTLIELLVVMTIIALLLSIAVPRYFGSVDRTREAVLHGNLGTLRESIDKFYADNGKYPAALDELVAKRYLRKVPVDPITESAETWVVLPPPDSKSGGVFDVHSSAPGKARDGTSYADW